MFGTVKLTKNTDIDKYRYSGYGIGFDRKGTSCFSSSEFCCNVTICGVEMSSSVHVDNKKKYILIIGESSTQTLDSTTLTTEKLFRQLYKNR